MVYSRLQFGVLYILTTLHIYLVSKRTQISLQIAILGVISSSYLYQFSPALPHCPLDSRQLSNNLDTPAITFFQANLHIGCKVGIHIQATLTKGSLKSTNLLLPGKSGSC